MSAFKVDDLDMKYRGNNTLRNDLCFVFNNFDKEHFYQKQINIVKDQAFYITSNQLYHVSELQEVEKILSKIDDNEKKFYVIKESCVYDIKITRLMPEFITYILNRKYEYNERPHIFKNAIAKYE